jgi:hypothetical protein
VRADGSESGRGPGRTAGEKAVGRTEGDETWKAECRGASEQGGSRRSKSPAGESQGGSRRENPEEGQGETRHEQGEISAVKAAGWP